jgi:hypothetical protein
VLKYVNGKKDISDCYKQSASQKQGIFDAIDEIDSQKAVAHKIVIDKYRKKYSNA